MAKSCVRCRCSWFQTSVVSFQLSLATCCNQMIRHASSRRTATSRTTNNHTILCWPVVRTFRISDSCGDISSEPKMYLHLILQNVNCLHSRVSLANGNKSISVQLIQPSIRGEVDLSHVGGTDRCRNCCIRVHFQMPLLFHSIYFDFLNSVSSSTRI